jgi:hypothetical protein
MRAAGVALGHAASGQDHETPASISNDRSEPAGDVFKIIKSLVAYCYRCEVHFGIARRVGKARTAWLKSRVARVDRAVLNAN